MENPWLAKLKPKKVSLKSLATDNGHRPSLAGLAKARKPSLASLKVKPLPQKQTKQDFYAGGLLYWNAQITDHDSRGHDNGVFRPVGTVDVSNGNQTYTFHNRYGSWMADMGAKMAEPAYIANLLGTNMGQVEMYQNIRDRFEAELKVQKVPTMQEQRRRVEEAEKAKRARKKPAAQPTKLSLKGLRK